MPMDSVFIIFVSTYKIPIIAIGAGFLALLVGITLLERRLLRRKLMKSQKFCRKCGGKGKLADKATCDLCNGSGIPPLCPICGGDGKIDAEKRCSYCMGTGVVIM
jgi:DnaJ-class molecular chaperone